MLHPLYILSLYAHLRSDSYPTRFLIMDHAHHYVVTSPGDIPDPGIEPVSPVFPASEELILYPLETFYMLCLFKNQK